VNTLAKGFLIAVAFIVIAVALAAGILKGWLGSATAREGIESALSEAVHAPVRIGELSFSFWDGLHARGVVIAQGSDASQPPLADVPEMTARLRWLPLLAGRLSIREIVFSNPSLVWIPRGVTAKDHAETTGSAQSAPQSSEAPAAARPSVAHLEREKSVRLELQSVRVENATLQWIGRDGAPVAALEGVQVLAPRVAGDAAGVLSFEKGSLYDRIPLESGSAQWSYADGTLVLNAITAQVAGGKMTGSYRLQPKRQQFSLDTVFEGLDLKTLLAEGGSRHAFSGSLSGWLDLYGRHGHPAKAGGVAGLRVRDGRMEQYPILQRLGQALQIEDLGKLDLRDAQADLRIGEGKLWIDRLALDSANLAIAASGTSDLDGGNLDLASVLSVTPKVSRQLPSLIHDHFQPVAGSDRESIAFHIGGSIARPEADLMRVLLGEKLQKQVMEVYRMFTGSSSKKDKEKAKEAKEKTPSAASSSLPVPAPGVLTPGDGVLDQSGSKP